MTRNDYVGAGRPAGVAEGEGGAKVSIVVPAHNTEKYVGECIESALAQTWPNTEVVVVDDGSTDGTPGVLAGYSDRVKIVRLAKCRGLPNARNRGVKESTGAWIKFLDSDDALEPGAVELLMGIAGALPASARVVPFADICYMDEAGNVFATADPYPYNSLSPVEQGGILLEDMYAGVSKQIISRQALDRVGGFNERYLIAEDVEFNLRLVIAHGYRFQHVQGVVYRYRKGRAGQLSRNLRGYRRAHQRAARDVLAGLGRGERAAYEAAKRKYLREKEFNLGVWHYANPDLAALSRRMHSGAPGMRALLRSPLARAAYRSLRSRSARPLAGWWWASRNPGHDRVARFRGRGFGMAMPN